MIEFTLVGNQVDKDGNPIPYHRTTQASFWNKDSKRYNAWKKFTKAVAKVANGYLQIKYHQNQSTTAKPSPKLNFCLTNTVY